MRPTVFETVRVARLPNSSNPKWYHAGSQKSRLSRLLTN